MVTLRLVHVERGDVSNEHLRWLVACASLHLGGRVEAVQIEGYATGSAAASATTQATASTDAQILR